MRVRLKSCKGKDKFRPKIGHEGPEKEYKYISTLALTSALDGGQCLTLHAGPFALREEKGCILYRRYPDITARS